MESELRRAVEAMYRASADDRGTVQTLCRDLDEAGEDGKQCASVRIIASHVICRWYYFPAEYTRSDINYPQGALFLSSCIFSSALGRYRAALAYFTSTFGFQHSSHLEGNLL